VNRLAQFLHYAQKVFALKTVLRAVRDGRPWPKIPTTPVLLTLVLGVVLRISSYLDLAQQTKRRRWRHLCALRAPISDDTFEYVTERLELEDLRRALASVAKTLKQNQARESRQIKGLLFLSLDAQAEKQVHFPRLLQKAGNDCRPPTGSIKSPQMDTTQK